MNNLPLLTEDEVVILRQLMKDELTTNGQLTRFIHVSIGTVRNRFNTLYKKFNLDDNSTVCYGHTKRKELIKRVRRICESYPNYIPQEDNHGKFN